MLNKYSYLQKRSYLNKLGSTRIANMLTKLAMRVGGINKILHGMNSGRTVRPLQVFAASTPAERQELMRIFNNPTELQARGFTNIQQPAIDDFKQTFNNYFDPHTYLERTPLTWKKAPGENIPLLNTGEGQYWLNPTRIDLGNGQFRNSGAVGNGSVVYDPILKKHTYNELHKTPVSLIDSEAYTGLDGYNMPVYNPATKTYVHVAMSPGRASALSRYYRSPAGHSFQLNTNVAKNVPVPDATGATAKNQFVSGISDDIGMYARDPDVLAASRRAAFEQQQLAAFQKQLEAQNTLNQANAGNGAAFADPDAARKSYHLGRGLVGLGGGAGLLWYLAHLWGTSDKPKLEYDDTPDE